MRKQLQLSINDPIGDAISFAKKYAGQMVKNNQLNWWGEHHPDRKPPWFDETIGRVIGYTDFNEDWPDKVLVEVVSSAHGYNDWEGRSDPYRVFVVADPPKRFAELSPLILKPVKD